VSTEKERKRERERFAFNHGHKSCLSRSLAPALSFSLSPLVFLSVETRPLPERPGAEAVKREWREGWKDFFYSSREKREEKNKTRQISACMEGRERETRERERDQPLIESCKFTRGFML
jgi:hypothetical protein